ncbi:MAG: hypothetical protein KDD69_04020 [Bdellovibrionales bacterium]|nr:hypothetical protein [Bdellovibrionales bacterium]
MTEAMETAKVGGQSQQDATPSEKPADRARITEIVQPGSFEPERHFYPRVLNASIHPLVGFFMHLRNDQIINRYCHLHPQTDRKALEALLQYEPKHLRWAGADLFHTTTAGGRREMVVIETNSCPSGQKAMPLPADFKEQGGYQFLVENTFAPAVAKHRQRTGELAVIYDKNHMGSSGYAAAIADHFNTRVFFTPFYGSDPNPPVRFRDGLMEVRDEAGDWHQIRAAFRYVTQKPWNRIPLHTKTLIFNPTLACLAGGRNKMVAAMAYDLLNAELAGTGLQIRIPETERDVHLDQIPLVLRKFGGHAVIKVPYSNAGQGVFTVTNQRELDEFMEREHPYQRFIVQSLIGNYEWSSDGALGRFYHIGTVPDRHNRIFVADLRMMIVSTPEGYRPLALYGRRAGEPLSDTLDDSVSSWSMLGTNLSVKLGVDSWDTETGRLLLMDRKDFNRLGVGLDDMIKAFIQAVLAAIAIDKMAATLQTQKGRFRQRLFQSINDDQTLLDEILID